MEKFERTDKTFKSDYLLGTRSTQSWDLLIVISVCQTILRIKSLIKEVLETRRKNK